MESISPSSRISTSRQHSSFATTGRITAKSATAPMARSRDDSTPWFSRAVTDASASFHCAKVTQGRLQLMPRARHHRKRDAENPEWTKEDFARARPASEAVPDIVAAYRRGRGPQKRPTKRLVSLRLDPDVIDHFRARGPGWQARINSTLRKAVGLS